MQDKLLTPQEVCSYLQIPISKLYSLSSTDSVPVYRIGRILRFRQSDLEKWLNENRSSGNGHGSF